MNNQTQYQTDPAEEQDFQKHFKADVHETTAKVLDLVSQAKLLEKDINVLRELVTYSTSVTPGQMNLLEDLADNRDEIYQQQYELVSIALAHRHTPTEVQEWYQRAEDMGCVRPRLGKALIEDLMYERKVPNAPFRAHHLGLLKTGAHGLIEAAAGAATNGDMSYLQRLLGIRSGSGGTDRDKRSLILWIPYDKAVALTGAWGLKPVDVGI